MALSQVLELSVATFKITNLTSNMEKQIYPFTIDNIKAVALKEIWDHNSTVSTQELLKNAIKDAIDEARRQAGCQKKGYGTMSLSPPKLIRQTQSPSSTTSSPQVEDNYCSIYLDRPHNGSQQVWHRAAGTRSWSEYKPSTESYLDEDGTTYNPSLYFRTAKAGTYDFRLPMTVPGSINKPFAKCSSLRTHRGKLHSVRRTWRRRLSPNSNSPSKDSTQSLDSTT